MQISSRRLRHKTIIDCTPAVLARRCLEQARGDPAKAITLARGQAHGARRQAVIAAIADALLRDVTNHTA
jgi:hypothetical protein